MSQRSCNGSDGIDEVVRYEERDTLAFQNGFMLITAVFPGALIPAWILCESTNARRPNIREHRGGGMIRGRGMGL